MGCTLTHYVYFARHMAGQLYRQMPESRCVAQKVSDNLNQHRSAELSLSDELQKEKPCLRVNGLALSGTRSRYRESLFDKNDMYQLERVLARLRQCGQLRGRGGGCRPGAYYEVCGEFTRQPEGAPAHCVWLQAAGLRLLCRREDFYPYGEEHSWEELFACGSTVPLCGVVLCMNATQETLCGQPLALGICEICRNS